MAIILWLCLMSVLIKSLVNLGEIDAGVESIEFVHARSELMRETVISRIIFFDELKGSWFQSSVLHVSGLVDGRALKS